MLQLWLQGNAAGTIDAETLAGLHGVPGLRALTIDLSGSGLQDMAVQGLAAGLCRSTALRTLHLELRHNPDLSNHSAAALAAFADAPALRDLALHLGNTGVDDLGARALARLCASPALRTLTLGGPSSAPPPLPPPSPLSCSARGAYSASGCPYPVPSEDEFRSGQN